jgi:hypothetical protein
MQWAKIEKIRVMIMVLLGFAALCVAAFLWTEAAGWAAVGVSLLAVAYLTDPSATP